MKYRLIESESAKFLTIDEDLEQNPIVKCDDTFNMERIGSLYNPNELTIMNIQGFIVARLKYRT